MSIPPFGSPPTPDATTLIKGKVQLAGDLGGTAAAPTVTDLTIASEAQGDILYRNATNWTRLAASTSGFFLKTQGAGADPVWAASGGQTIYDIVVAASGGDYTTLQAALAAATNGQTIFVKSGTFALVANTASSLTDIRIIGEDPRGSIIDLATFSLTLSGARVSIDGIKFIGTATSTGKVLSTGDNITVTNCWFNSSNSTSVFNEYQGLNARVTNNLFQATGTTCQRLFVIGNSNALVEANYFLLGGNSNSSSQGPIVLESNYCSFTGNYINLTAGINTAGTPLIYVGGNPNIITDNIIYQDSIRSTSIYLAAGNNATVKNNYMKNTYTGIDLSTGARHSVVGNTIIDYSTSGYGIHNQAGDNFQILGNTVYQANTTGTGIRVVSDNGYVNSNYVEGGQYGIRIAVGSSYNTVTGNTIKPSSTSLYGIALEGVSNTVTGNAITAVGTTGGRCIYVDATCNVVSANYLRLGQTGLQTSANATYCTFTGNVIEAAGTGIDITSEYSVYTGNIIRSSATADISYGTNNKSNMFINNQGTGLSVINDTKIVYMKNVSGGAFTAGNVVILNSVAAGNEVTTTTTAGADLVYGMAVEATANNAFGPIQVLGKTVLLKVNGTTDIAIGDFLATYTTAGIAAKAAAGDMCFAIALEAYTGNDDNGVIDALLVSPRLI